MYIKQVYIKNLWQKGNILWDLNHDVNVLVGINGSGKSTILNLVYEALQPQISEDAKKKYFSLINELTIHLSDDTFVIADSSGERFPVNTERLNIRLDIINTFDISGSLDNLIADLHTKFETYQKNLYKKFDEWIKSPGAQLSDSKVEEIFGRRKAFIEIINQLFKESKKTFLEDSFSFKLENQQYELNYKQLSSGEKQIFYILLLTLIQDGTPSVLLMDEPEISLHIDWQRDLIYHIRRLNENCQVIAVTHSSNLYYKGWAESMKRIDDIRQAKSDSKLAIDLPSRLSTFATEFSKLINHSEKNDRLVNDVNAMIHRTFFMLSLDECNKILKTMADAQIAPDHFTYTTLISKTTNKSDALELLDRMKKRKITPNSVTYVNVLKKTDSFDEALSIFDQMRADRIEPAIQHFSVLLGKADNPAIVERVEELRSLYGVPTNDIYSNKLRIKQ